MSIVLKQVVREKKCTLIESVHPNLNREYKKKVARMTFGGRLNTKTFVKNEVVIGIK